MKIITALIFIIFGNFCFYAQQYTDIANLINVQESYGTSGEFGGGVSFCDFNGDGLDDISFATAQGDSLKFYQNLGNGFMQVDFNIANINQVKQINWVDVDNDGDQDLFFTRFGFSPKIYQNIGNMVFSDASLSAGFFTSLKGFGSSWGDINNDGFLDVLICVRDDDASSITGNKLYLNNGNFSFNDISASAGIEDLNDLSFCAALVDINLDGWIDIYIANDRSEVANELFLNNGDLTFSDISNTSGASVFMDAMSATVGDFNYDGYPDFYTTNTYDGNVLLMNNGDDTFNEIADSLGVLFESIAWGAVFLDGDNDMDLDLYVSGSLGPSTGFLPSAYYERTQVDTFEIKTLGFELDTAASFSNAIGDLNNDGFPDIIVTNLSPFNHFIYENSPNLNHWIKINLEGTISNRNGVGARIELSSAGQLQYNYTLLGEGFLSQNSFSEFFGIGSNTTIDSVTIFWPSGIIDKLYLPEIDQSLFLIEGFSASTVSINESQKPTQLTIYPNPSINGFFSYSLNSNEVIREIEFTNSLGQVISDVPVTENSIDLNKLDQGIYFIKIRTNSRVYITDLIYK